MSLVDGFSLQPRARRGKRTSTRKNSETREKVLAYITESQPYSPSIREICEAVGVSSSSTVHAHVKALKAQGHLAPAGAYKPRRLVPANHPVLAKRAVAILTESVAALRERMAAEPTRELRQGRWQADIEAIEYAIRVLGAGQ